MVVPIESKYDDDYEYTRKKLKILIEEGEDAINTFKEIAGETQEPRAYHVLSELLKTTSEITKGIMDNAAQKSNIDNRKPIPKNIGENITTTNNNNTAIFVGTTKELLEQINREEEKIITIEQE